MGNFDCNACNDEPKFYQVDKIAKRAACWATAGTFGAAMKVILGMCDNYSGQMDASAQIDAAKQLLINAKVWNHHDFDGVRIRLCPIKDVNILGFNFGGADGMVPEAKHILIDVHQKDTNVENLASLIAHEMKHVQQYDEWGNGKFRCTYSGELISGHGFGMNNVVEKDAYEFQNIADKAIRAYTMGVRDLGYHDSIRQFKDVNGDGKADYCREVGNRPDSYISCALATDHGFVDGYELRLSDGECQVHGWDIG